jgi:hypothetical protein
MSRSQDSADDQGPNTIRPHNTKFRQDSDPAFSALHLQQWYWLLLLALRF